MKEWQIMNIVGLTGLAFGAAYWLASKRKGLAFRRVLQGALGIVLLLAGIAKFAVAQGFWFPVWMGPTQI